MMKSAFVLLFSLAVQSASAEMLEGQVLRVEPPEQDELHLIYLDSGRVLRVRDGKQADILTGAMLSGEKIRTLVSEEFGEDHVTSIQASENLYTDLNRPQINELDAEDKDENNGETDTATDPEALTSGYIPTELPDLETASRIHRGLNNQHVIGSICSNRAHLWAYRMYRDHGVKSMKAFLFFTTRYIRKYRGKWWYHVTPYVHVNGVPYATDRTFFKEPKELSAWASYFVKNRFTCPYIDRYSDYTRNKQTGYCYVRRVPGTVWWPREVAAMDNGHVPSNTFNTGQIRSAATKALPGKVRRKFQY